MPKFNNEYLDKLIQIDDFGDYTTKEILLHFSHLIDLSLDFRSREGIQNAIDSIEKIDLSFFTDSERAIFFYFIGNAWCNKVSICHPQKSDPVHWHWNQKEYEKAIYHFRMSIKSSGFQELSKQYQCHILTNLANLFDTIGRTIEAIDYWQKALSKDPHFGMALGNLGQGLNTYGRSVYDTGHQGIFLWEAREKLLLAVKQLLEIEDYQFAVDGFITTINELNGIIGYAVFPDWRKAIYSLGSTAKEQSYRRWGLQHKLFLNPLNDIENHNIAARDILTVPDMVTELEVGPKSQGFYNQMKQEYVSARFLFYEAINATSPHFSDKDVTLFNTLDNPCYGFAVEKLKMAFRTTYSLFDKIAYFINDYFELKIPARKVNFRTLWFDNEKKEIRKEFDSKANLSLRALYWLSKDFFDYGDDEKFYRQSVEPEAEELNLIRNHLEHQYLKIHTFLMNGDKKPGYSPLRDELAYSITKKDFEQKTLRLLQLARNALIYLSLAIHTEEFDRAQNRPNKGLIMPFFNDLWEDDWKI